MLCQSFQTYWKIEICPVSSLKWIKHNVCIKVNKIRYKKIQENKLILLAKSKYNINNFIILRELV